MYLANPMNESVKSFVSDAVRKTDSADIKREVESMTSPKEPEEEWDEVFQKVFADIQKHYRVSDSLYDILSDSLSEHLPKAMSQAKSQGAREALESLKTKLGGMQFVQPSQAGQFALHTDGYNQGIEEAIEVIEATQSNLKEK